MSPNFENNGLIPRRYSCEGEDINPTLQFLEVPKGAATLAIIMHDPDAPREGGFTHWLLWNLDPDTKIITENSVPLGAGQGKNGSGEKGYRGPCPPAGSEHRYYFELYALDIKLDLNEDDADRAVLEKAIDGHVIDKAKLMGIYKREE